MALRRDWQRAREKVEQEGACRVCGAREGERRGTRFVRLEAAHLAGREFDRPAGARLTGVVEVEPDDVVPLCGPYGDTRACHTLYDHHKLDLLPYLRRSEEVAIVRHLGIAGALKRLGVGR